MITFKEQVVIWYRDYNKDYYKINETVSSSIDMAIPDNIQAGKYNLYVQFKIDDREVDGETKPYGLVKQLKWIPSSSNINCSP